MSAGFVVGVAVGLLVGSAVTLLFTPRSGVETRRELSALGAETREPSNSVDEIIGIGRSLLSWLMTRVQDALAGGQAASAEARRALREEWAARLRGGSA